jgi:hypothetical protein
VIEVSEFPELAAEYHVHGVPKIVHQSRRLTELAALPGHHVDVNPRTGDVYTVELMLGHQGTSRTAAAEWTSTRSLGRRQDRLDRGAQLLFGHVARVIEPDDPVAVDERERRHRGDAEGRVIGLADRHRLGPQERI